MLMVALLLTTPVSHASYTPEANRAGVVDATTRYAVWKAGVPVTYAGEVASFQDSLGSGPSKKAWPVCHSARRSYGCSAHAAATAVAPSCRAVAELACNGVVAAAPAAHAESNAANTARMGLAGTATGWSNTSCAGERAASMNACTQVGYGGGDRTAAQHNATTNAAGVSPGAKTVQNRAAICRFAISQLSQPIQHLEPSIQVQSIGLDVLHRAHTKCGSRIKQFHAQEEASIAYGLGPLHQPTLTLAAASGVWLGGVWRC
jgi:hypothetical protein